MEEPLTKEMEDKTEKKPFDFLLSPWAIAAGIVLGFLIGMKNKNLAFYLVPFGEIYLSLLQMCILPILITAIISSVGRLIKQGDAKTHVGYLVCVFFLGLVLASIVGAVTGFFGEPGLSLSESNRTILGKLLSQSEMSDSSAEMTSPKIIDFFVAMVPKNIFAAINQEKNLAILFFSIVLGVALGYVRSKASSTALSVFEGIFDSFQKLIGWLMYGLPLGLCCLFASQISQVGFEILGALMKLVVMCYLGAFVLIFIYHVIIWRLTGGGSFLRPLLALRETLTVSFGTSSSFAAIASALRCLEDHLKVDKKTANLVLPLGVSVNPQGNTLHFAISTLFIAQIYGFDFNLESITIIILGSVFAGMAATGAPGTGSLAMIALVLDPLNLPSQAAFVLLMAIDPILDPILTVVNVHSNCAATVLVSSRQFRTLPRHR